MYVLKIQNITQTSEMLSVLFVSLLSAPLQTSSLFDRYSDYARKPTNKEGFFWNIGMFPKQGFCFYQKKHASGVVLNQGCHGCKIVIKNQLGFTQQTRYIFELFFDEVLFV